MAVFLSYSLDRLAEFCRRWKIAELSLFGSVLRSDFRPDSDVDVLVVFEAGVQHEVDSRLAMEAELESMFGREIDLVERRRLVNPYRRHHILTHRRVLY